VNLEIRSGKNIHQIYKTQIQNYIRNKWKNSFPKSSFFLDQTKTPYPNKIYERSGEHDTIE
jgi:hypothetical protein